MAIAEGTAKIKLVFRALQFTIIVSFHEMLMSCFEDEVLRRRLRHLPRFP